MPAAGLGLADAPRSSAGGGAWERLVRVARPELTAARDDVESAGAGRLLLNVREGVRLDVVVERTAPTRWGYSLSGRVAGGGVGFVTLVVHEDAVAGSIWTPGAAYELSFLGGGVHALRDVTNTRPLECDSLPTQWSVAGTNAQGGTDDGSVVDVLVVWTSEAESHYGGEPQLLSVVDMLIAYANDAFDRSGVFVSLSLAGAEKAEYSEVGTWDDINRLSDPDDGHMDHVHDRRNVLGADLIHLLTRHGQGRASRGGAFSTGGGRPARAAYVFAHEVGHNFGLGHERYIDAEWGYYYGFTTEACEITIMSYGDECLGRSWTAIPFYASPWRYSLRGGGPLGVSRFAKERGARGSANAVLTLNRNRHRVANLRSSRNGE